MAAHEVNIERYRIRYNAFNITCRISSETLATIFQELVKIAHNDPWYHHVERYSDRQPMRWVRAVSHVCSHWRSVALSTPTLWSNLPMRSPRWALEMIERSKGTFLIVNYYGMFEAPYSPHIPTSYTVLTEVFKSHLSRVKSLVLQLRFAMSNLDHGNPFHRQRRLKESSTELFSLAQQAAPLMEHLELQFEPSEKNMLPNDMVIAFSKLEALILEGCSMNWDLARFHNLKTLSLSRIPARFRPSMVQLLDILSQTPFLETLKITETNDSASQGGIASLQVVVPISLVHLGNIELSCDLRSSALFFDNILFSGKASRIELEHTVSPPLATLHDSEYSIAFMKRLASRVQNNVEGSLLKLMLREKMLCLKSSLGPGSEPTTRIEIDLREHGEFLIALGNAFWQSLRVDQLVFLEVEDFRLDMKAWMMFGDLPFLEELFVRSNECPLLEVLSFGVRITQPGIPGLRPSFVALKRLITFGWGLHKPGSFPGETIAMQIVNCFRSRKSAGLYLESLSLEESRRINNETLAELRKVIGEVYGDSNDWLYSAVDSESENEDDDSYL